jgi:hypothetical protein
MTIDPAFGKVGAKHKVPMSDEDVLKLYNEHGRIASHLAPLLGCTPASARKRVAKALRTLDDGPMMAEQADPTIPNLIQHELAKSSIALEGSRVNSAWVKGKHLSVHISPDRSATLPVRPFRIAFVDIETAPNLGYTWGKYEQNVLAFEREWYMMAFAVMWEGDARPQVHTLPDSPDYDDDRTNDALLVTKFWNVLDEADLVIAHNGDKFDVKKANARFVQHGMDPPSPYKTVDTLKIARARFGFTSNKLDDLARVLGVGRKSDTGGFSLWLECMAGDRKAWRKMARYCGHDVVLLAKVYDKLRAWHTTHPNIESGTCPTCGSDELSRRGTGFSNGKRFQRLQCLGCGRWMKAT